MNGEAGRVGPRSVHMHVVPLMQQALEIIVPDMSLVQVLENAGSLKEKRSKYLMEQFGAGGKDMRLIDSGLRTASTRRRFFITPFPMPISLPQQENPPWEEGWKPS